MSKTSRWDDPRRVLARHGLQPRRHLSQSFLVAHPTVEHIAEAVDPTAGEPIVELGPGVGTLTRALLQRGAYVIAVDVDPKMCSVVRAELGAYENLEVREGDASTVDLTSIAESTGTRLALTGNLPYTVTGGIMRNLFAHRHALSRAVVMVQREVRDRLCAEPGSRQYGALTVFASAVYSIEPLFSVRPGSFYPPPQVHSAVVRMTPRAHPRAQERDSLQQVVRAVFDARRKTLRNGLRQLAGGSAERADLVLQQTGIDGKRRGETLSVEELDALAAAWERA